MQLYPLQFTPIFKERIWGGEKLALELNKEFSGENIGESWEISTVSDNISIIENGFYKGRQFTHLITEFPEGILGTEVFARFGAEFPLLFKFIDAKDDLSIQVHPNDNLALKRHNTFGKTEMWYIMDAEEDSKIILGFKERSSRDIYLKHLDNNTLPSILDEISVNKGDVFLLNTGTVHAIRAGILLAEIQQTSDITYRIYDWDRLDDQGQSRELHSDLALDAINYDIVHAKKEYLQEIDSINRIIDCPYFTSNFIPLSGQLFIEQDTKSFRVFMCVDGEFEITSGEKYCYKRGDTVLIPAAMQGFAIMGKASILEIYIS